MNTKIVSIFKLTHDLINTTQEIENTNETIYKILNIQSYKFE